MPANQLPTRDQLFAEKTWDRAPSYLRTARGLSSDDCKYNEDKDNDWYESLSTGQLGYVKNIQLVEKMLKYPVSRIALSEDMAAGFAHCIDLLCPQVEIAVCQNKGCEQITDYVCHSPLLGTHPRELCTVNWEIAQGSPIYAQSIDQISHDISSLIPFWIWTANKDAHGGNVIIASLPSDQPTLRAYGIDYECVQTHADAIAKIASWDIFVPSMPFYIDTNAMTQKASAIASLPESKIQETIEQSFHNCKISLCGGGDDHFYLTPSAREIRDVFLKRQETIETDIHTPDYMAKVFQLSLEDYKALNKRPEAARPPPALAAKAAGHGR